MASLSAINQKPKKQGNRIGRLDVSKLERATRRLNFNNIELKVSTKKEYVNEHTIHIHTMHSMHSSHSLIPTVSTDSTNSADTGDAAVATTIGTTGILVHTCHNVQTDLFNTRSTSSTRTCSISCIS